MTLVPIEQELTRDAEVWLEQARTVQIVDDASYALWVERVQIIKDLETKIEDTLGPHIDRMFQAHRALVAEKKKAQAPLLEAKRVITAAMVAWNIQQTQAAEEDAARLREVARKDAEGRQLAQAAAMEREAQATGDESLMAEAERILREPVTVPTIIVAPPAAMSGVSFRKRWGAKVTNLSALIGWVNLHPEHVNLLVPNDKALNDLARATEGRLRIPGVEMAAVQGVAVRGSR